MHASSSKRTFKNRHYYRGYKMIFKMYKQFPRQQGGNTDLKTDN